MFKKLLSLFSKKGQLPIIPDPPEESDPPEEPVQLPDTIEVPWKECAGIKNYEDAITKTHHDLKEFLYNVKMKEISAIRAIEKLEKSSDTKIEEIKEQYLKGQSKEYTFVVPNATGKSGFLKRKKTNK
jgi:hypothetical protein